MQLALTRAAVGRSVRNAVAHGAGRSRFLTPLQTYEIFLPLVRQEVTVIEAVERWAVDRSQQQLEGRADDAGFLSARPLTSRCRPSTVTCPDPPPRAGSIAELRGDPSPGHPGIQRRGPVPYSRAQMLDEDLTRLYLNDVGRHASAIAGSTDDVLAEARDREGEKTVIRCVDDALADQRVPSGRHGGELSIECSRNVT